MKNSKNEEDGMSARLVDTITTVFLVLSSFFLIYSLDLYVAEVIGKKTSLLQERIDRVIANNR